MTGETTLVSVASSGEQGSGESLGPSLSGDGRYVAFISWSPDLVPGDNNGSPDAFVHDRVTGETNLVSKVTDGSSGNNWSEALALSADGRFVAFVSDSTNPVPGDTNNSYDIFLHNRVTGITTRVSVASDGSQAQGGVSLDTPAISETGRYVAFASWSTLVAGDDNSTIDIFVHDQQTGQTTLASVSTDGQISESTSNSPSISDDGRYAGFTSAAANLVPDDTNGYDVFVHDRVTGVTTRVSVASNGDQGNSDSLSSSALSADGRYVGFLSNSSNLVAGDNNNKPDIFVHDRLLSRTVRVNVPQNGEEANDWSYSPVDLSADGLFVTFNSDATNLVPGDTNDRMDVFLTVQPVFADGFESGDTLAWSNAVP